MATKSTAIKSTTTIARQGRGTSLHISTQRGNVAYCNGGGIRMVAFHSKREVTTEMLLDLFEAGAICGRCARAAHLPQQAEARAAVKAAPAAKVRANVVEASNGTYECTCGCQSTGITRRQARRAHRAQQAA